MVLRRMRFKKVPSRRDWLAAIMGGLIVAAGFGITAMIHNAKQPLGPESTKISSPWIPPTVKHWEVLIDKMAKRYDVDPNLLAIIMTLESGGDPNAKSEVGAQGLMQIMPLTAKDISQKFLKQPRASYKIMDPETNIEFGAAYLAYLRDEFGTANQGPSWNNTVEIIAAGYNGGPGAANSLEQGQGLTSAQTVIYSRDAYNMWRERHADNSPTYDRWLERGGSRLIESAKENQKN